MDTLTHDDVNGDELLVLADAIRRLPERSHLAGALERIFESLEEGMEVVVASIDEELSPNQAAHLLRMSRPHLYKLLDSGVIPSHRVGDHRRIRVQDVNAFRARREEARRHLAESFARVDSSRRRLDARLAGLDRDTAERLGF